MRRITEIPLHPETETLQQRLNLINERSGVQVNMLRLLKKDSIFDGFDVLDVGFVNYLN